MLAYFFIKPEIQSHSSNYYFNLSKSHFCQIVQRNCVPRDKHLSDSLNHTDLCPLSDLLLCFLLLPLVPQALSMAHVQWSQQLDVLGYALSDQLGTLALVAAYTSYLTPLPPNSTLSVINSHILPCIAEKGFTIDLRNKLTTSLFQPLLTPPLVSSTHSPSDNGSPKSSDSDAEDSPPPPPPPTATPHLPPVPLDEDQPSIDSFDELAHCLLGVLSSDRLRSHYVFTSLNTIRLLCMALVGGAWNRWPLIFDPEGMAVQCVQQCWDEEMEDEEQKGRVSVVVDARYRYVCVCIPFTSFSLVSYCNYVMCKALIQTTPVLPCTRL